MNKKDAEGGKQKRLRQGSRHKALEDEARKLKAELRVTEKKRDDLVEAAYQKIDHDDARRVILERLHRLLVQTYESHLRADQQACLAALENLHDKYAVPAKDIEARRELRETEQYLSVLGQSLSVRVDPGDLVMSICGTLGRPIIIDMPACIHDGFVQFSNLRNVDTEYLFYALQHAELALVAMGQPGTQTNLNTSLVGRHRIYCPEIPIQVKVTRVLSTIDEVIEKTEALIAKSREIKLGLMHDLFTRGPRSPCESRKRYLPDLLDLPVTPN